MQTDLLGRTVRVSDATGNTSCYRYDARVRKVAEWGTVIQPSVFSYDDADRMASLTTSRANTENITTDPGDRTNGDITTWTYHDAAGLETCKTYDASNRLSVETPARGITKTHSYEHARGILLGTAYSDGSAACSYRYNHLGQLVQVTDGSEPRNFDSLAQVRQEWADSNPATRIEVPAVQENPIGPLSPECKNGAARVG